MKSIYPLTLLILLLGTYVESIELQPRRASNCALLSNQIYCYGGYILGTSADDVLNSLDIYKNNGGPVQNLNSQWNSVTPTPSGIIFGRREFSQAVPLPDGNRYLIQGGYNYVNSTIVNQSIAYNAKTNAWEILADYYDANNGGNRQIYYGTGVYVPTLNAVGFYGGYQQHVTPGTNFITPSGAALSGLTFNNSDGYINSYAGFYYFTLYNLNTNTWSVPQQYNIPTDYHISQSGTFHPLSKKIFYLGGNFFNTTSQSVYNSYLTYSMSFNTVSGQWLYESISGPAPSQRSMHTTTLLPTGQDILLYGGTLGGSVAVMDYCYTLNIPSMSWTYHNLIAPVGTSGPRSHHAAVMVNQTSLFILFGLDKDSNPTNDLLILDIRDVNNISFANHFPFDNDVVVTTGNGSSTNGTSTITSKAGLSIGAIAGIAVGGVAAGAILVLAFICFSRRKNRQGGNNNGNSTHYEQQKNNESELLEVDWDKIEDHYKEISLPQQQHQYVQRTSMADDLYSEPTASSKISSAAQPPDIATVTSETTRSSTAISPDTLEPRSSTTTTAVAPDVALPPMMMKVVKPDGA